KPARHATAFGTRGLGRCGTRGQAGSSSLCTGPVEPSSGTGTFSAPPNDNATRGGDLPDNGQGARARRRAASTTEARRRACSSSVGSTGQHACHLRGRRPPPGERKDQEEQMARIDRGGDRTVCLPVGHGPGLVLVV